MLLACVLTSGFAVRIQADVALIAHYALNVLSAIALAAFLKRHWWIRRDRVEKHGNAHLGRAMLGCMAALWVSGVALLIWTNETILRMVHVAASMALGLFLLWHAAWRWRTARSLHEPRVMPFAFAALMAGATGVGWWSTVAFKPVPQPYPSQTMPAGSALVAHATIKPGALPSATECATCHGDFGTQWRGSAHANALNDKYYAGLAGMFGQERGAEALRYCATCHNPIGLMEGEIDPRLAQTNQPGTNAYEVRGLGVNMSSSARAAEGVTCAMCHRAISANAVNGAMVVNSLEVVLPKGSQAQLALQAAPAAHRAELRPDVLQQADLCGACHNLRTPDGILLEPTFDEWRGSRYAREGITCQGCHMPQTIARKVDSALPGMVRAHGGQPGAPSSLSGVDGGSSLLTRAAALNISASTDIITVTVANTGTGHYLPSGADDLREVWLEVRALDASGAVLWQSGILDRYGALPPDAVRFGKVLGDTRGQPIALHRFWLATTILQDTRLAPDEARALKFRMPAGATRVVASLRYRDVSPAFAEVALNQKTNVPVRDIATRELEVSQ